MTTCVGLQEALMEQVSAEEMVDDADGEIEANSPESWKLIQDKASSVLEEASKGVTEGTGKAYKR
jgi:hypothetical protein